MKKSGSPESPYHLTGRAEEKVERLIRSEESQLQKFSNLCLLLGLLICGIKWLFGLLWPSLNLNGSLVTDWIFLIAMGHSFVYRKEKQALAFAGVFWMTEFIVALNTLGQGFAQASRTFTSSLYSTFSNVLMFFFALYVLAASFEPLTYRRQKFYHTFKPILKLVTVLVLVISLLLGLIGFFGGIRLNYLNLTSLAYLLGAALMLAVISREFDREMWMRPIKRLGPPLFLAVLFVFSLLQGILQFAILYKTVSVPGFLLFLFPILKMLFSAVFVLPVYLLLAWGFRYPVRVRATERNHIVGAAGEEILENETQMPSVQQAAAVMSSTEAEQYQQEALQYTDHSAQGFTGQEYGAQAYAAQSYGSQGYDVPEETVPEYNPLQGAQQPHEAWLPLGGESYTPAQQEPAVPTWNPMKQTEAQMESWDAQTVASEPQTQDQTQDSLRTTSQAPATPEPQRVHPVDTPPTDPATQV